MGGVTIKDILNAVEASTNFGNFRQKIMHLQGITTKLDHEIHKRNLRRAEMIRDNPGKCPFRPSKHKASFIEDEFAEFRGTG